MIIVIVICIYICLPARNYGFYLIKCLTLIASPLGFNKKDSSKATQEKIAVKVNHTNQN